MKMPKLKLEASAKMLSAIAGRELYVSGTAESCMLVDKDFVDVLRSGFVKQSDLETMAAAALAFAQLGPKGTMWQQSNGERVAIEPQNDQDLTDIL